MMKRIGERADYLIDDDVDDDDGDDDDKSTQTYLNSTFTVVNVGSNKKGTFPTSSLIVLFFFISGPTLVHLDIQPTRRKYLFLTNSLIINIT